MELTNRENKLYIAYGSNLNLAQMKRRCPYATIVGHGLVRDYELLFRGGNGGSVATIEPKLGKVVPVLIWEITPRCEDALDSYEGFPHLYRKETLAVEHNGKTVQGMAYIMNGHRLGAPSDHYLNAILEGYITAGFDSSYLQVALKESTTRREGV